MPCRDPTAHSWLPLTQSGALRWDVRVRTTPPALGGSGRLLQALVGAPRTPGPGARRLSPSLAAQPASGAAVIGTGRRGGCPSGGSGLAHARCRGAWGDCVSPAALQGKPNESLAGARRQSAPAHCRDAQSLQSRAKHGFRSSEPPEGCWEFLPETLAGAPA